MDGITRGGRRHHQQRRLSTGIAVATLLLSSPVAGHAAPAPQTRAAGSAVTITLVTGDRVVLHRTAGPEAGFVLDHVSPGPGRAGMAFEPSKDPRSGISVVPADARPFIESGRLDRRLFAVEALARAGYDDAHRSRLPLIVGASETGHLTASLRSLGTTRARLESLDADPLAVEKSRLGTFWQRLTAAAARTTAFTEGAQRVWFDAPVTPEREPDVAIAPQHGSGREGRPTGRRGEWDSQPPRGARAATDPPHGSETDWSRRRVKAPEVWARGITGKNILVADLDTGYDQHHPDLAGQVVEARDFTGSPEGVQDIQGHGTHTASTIAGTGSASGGAYAGVAPGAKLLIGKVLSDNSSESMVIAGMEWAAQRHAKAINMSLHTIPTGDDTAPVAQAADRLTRTYHSLFVCAAGNEGPIPYSVNVPAAAEAALAVASTNRDDMVANSSSRGPRMNDGVLKPEIAAPGVDVVAARSDTSRRTGLPENPQYYVSSGTSMAAPHVTGAVALLAQAHPDWRPEQLKASLASSADPTPTGTVYEEGDGRLNVERALTQSVTASRAVAGFGILTWGSTSPVTQSVEYRNDSSESITLALRLESVSVTPDQEDGWKQHPAPAGLTGLDRDRLTVPAHGSASVHLTLHPRLAAPGLYGGRLTATSTGVHLQTAWGAVAEPESHQLTVRVLDREGRAAPDGAEVAIFPLTPHPPALPTNQNYPPKIWTLNGTASIRLPRGEYVVNTWLLEKRSDGALRAATVLNLPRVNLDTDHSLNADAREAKPLLITLDHAEARQAWGSVALAVNAGAETFTDDLDNRLRIVEGRGAKTTAQLFAGLASPGVDLIYNAEFVGSSGTETWSLQQRTHDTLNFVIHDRDLATIQDSVAEGNGEIITKLSEKPYWEGKIHPIHEERFLRHLTPRLPWETVVCPPRDSGGGATEKCDRKTEDAAALTAGSITSRTWPTRS
jgi:hypothetical protein